jgi:hypothetical protein
MNTKKLLVVLFLSGVITGCTNLNTQHIDAKSIALSDANVDEGLVVGLKIEEERDYFTKTYEVSFFDDNYQYEYEIDRNGIITKCDKEMMSYRNNSLNSNQKLSITDDEVRAIVFEDAGIKPDNVEELRVFKRSHHGVIKYNVKFVYDRRYFEYKVSSDGDILDVEITKIH